MGADSRFWLKRDSSGFVLREQVISESDHWGRDGHKERLLKEKIHFKTFRAIFDFKEPLEIPGKEGWRVGKSF